jgi:hypothetical protein
MGVRGEGGGVILLVLTALNNNTAPEPSLLAGDNNKKQNWQMVGIGVNLPGLFRWGNVLCFGHFPALKKIRW